MVSKTENMSALAQELLTVDAVLASNGPTRRVDALNLMYIKCEKQMRRMFCFLVFQHPSLQETDLDGYIETIVAERGLYYYTLIGCYDALAKVSLEEMVGPEYGGYISDLKRIKGYRNKLIHGQITGLKLSSRALERDIVRLRQWMAAVALAGSAHVGYDGVGRNTFRAAKATRQRAVGAYPWADKQGFRAWLVEALKPPPPHR